MIIGDEWLDEDGGKMVIVEILENDGSKTIVSHTEED